MPTIEELQAQLEHTIKVAHKNLDEVFAVHRRLAAAELSARQGWERYEMANKGHMATQMQLAEANAKLHKLGITNDLPKPE